MRTGAARAAVATVPALVLVACVSVTPGTTTVTDAITGTPTTIVAPASVRSLASTSTGVTPGTTPVVTVPVADPPSACPIWRGATLGATRALLAELSGLAVSRRNPGVVWSHNDSGDDARLFALDEQLHVRAELRVDGADAFDWEDVAAATGPDGSPWLWIADTGDNFVFHPTAQLHLVPEPDLRPVATGAVIHAAALTTIVMRYPNGPHHVESLAVDPPTGDAFLVAKALDSERMVDVYRVPATTTRGHGRVEVEVEVVARIVGADRGSVGPTAADCRFDAGPGEAVAFTPDGQHLYSIAEGIGSHLHRYDRS
jgi:hypothetical protein